MREILFRGKRRDNGEWFYGDLLHLNYCVSIRSKKCAHSIFPETAGQFTGLTDKNGNKIFEGDIVELKFSGATGIIILYRGCYCIQVHAFGRAVSNALRDYDKDDMEIIGNIHDNPELIGGEEN